MSAVIEQPAAHHRQGFLGGSDAAAALGVGKWKSQLDLWLEKTGRTEPFKGNRYTHWGETLEGIIADEYAQHTGRKVRRQPKAFVHPEYGFLRGQIDRRVLNERAGLEVKTAGQLTDEWGPDGTDQVPDDYLLQCAHYMAVGNLDEMHLACLFMREREFRVYEIKRDLELEKMLIAGEVKFWARYVLTDQAPPPRSGHDIDTLYYADDGSTIVADDELQDAVRQLKAIRDVLKQYEALEEDIKSQIKQRMGEAAVIVDDTNSPIVTWKKANHSLRLDPKLVEEDYPEVFDACLMPVAGSRRFVIK